MDEALIIELWDTFKEYIPDKNREIAANQYIDFLLGRDIELSVIEGLMGYDSNLDEAIKNVIDEENPESYEDEDDYTDEDEDY